jgi:hypothetical protein
VKKYWGDRLNNLSPQRIAVLIDMTYNMGGFQKYDGNTKKYSKGWPKF